MINDYLFELPLEVYLYDSPLTVNVAFLRDVGSSDLRFKSHLEVPNSVQEDQF